MDPWKWQQRSSPHPAQTGRSPRLGAGNRHTRGFLKDFPHFFSQFIVFFPHLSNDCCPSGGCRFAVTCTKLSVPLCPLCGSARDIWVTFPCPPPALQGWSLGRARIIPGAPGSVGPLQQGILLSEITQKAGKILQNIPFSKLTLQKGRDMKSSLCFQTSFLPLGTGK